MSTRRLLLLIAAALPLLLVAAVVISLAVPMKSWRTGEGRVPPLALDPPGAHATPARRVWVDTDAACGVARRVDVDDCWALIALARASDVEIAGISSVFGNAVLEDVDRVTRALVAQLGLADRFHSGASGPPSDQSPATQAQGALTQALEAGPLTIMALGPLTNVAAVLRARPDLTRHVAGIVAVMGQRPGHVFHPIEGGQSNMLLGHGPIFRDFNVAKDIAAVRVVVDARVPLTLIPYEAARMVTITKADLDRLETQGGASTWVAGRSRAWLSYWREDIGVEGFYPFDLLAAAYLRRPDLFRCAVVPVSVEKQRLPWRIFLSREALFVAGDEAADTRATYCAEAVSGARDGAVALLLQR